MLPIIQDYLSETSNLEVLFKLRIVLYTIPLEIINYFNLDIGNVECS